MYEGFEEAGFLSEALNNYMVFLGWSNDGDKEIYSMKELIKDFSLEKATTSKAEQKAQRKREEVDYLYDGDRWEVVVPKTKAVSCDMAGAPLTRWCTASDNWNYYERYSGQGPLYMIR